MEIVCQLRIDVLLPGWFRRNCIIRFITAIDAQRQWRFFNNYSSIEFRHKGFRALNKELGAVDTVIFMRQFESGYGNYTEERGASM